MRIRGPAAGKSGKPGYRLLLPGSPTLDCGWVREYANVRSVRPTQEFSLRPLLLLVVLLLVACVVRAPAARPRPAGSPAACPQVYGS